MRWLRDFFRSENPLVKLVAALTEPEALMRRELLDRNGLPAMVKNTGALQSHLQLPFSQDYDLYVKRSDAEQAAEILGPLMDVNPPEGGPSSGNGGRGNGSGAGYVR